MTEPVPTIFIVDDDAAVRRGLQRLLKSVGLRTRAFSNAREFLAQAATCPHGCVLLDVRMPGPDGLEAQRVLAEEEIALPIIFITGHGDIPMSVEAMKRGAVDFLTKPFEDETLLRAIDRALESDWAQRKRSAQINAIQERINTLTPRERHVVELVVAGLLNKQIGSRLCTTENTVKVHRGRVMRKLQAGSLAELVRMAERVGIGVEGT